MFGINTKKQFRKKKNLTPRRDWRIIIYVFIALLVLSMGFHLYMYYQISQESFFEISATDTPDVPQLKQDEVSAVVTEFKQVREVFQELQENPPEISDPS